MDIDAISVGEATHNFTRKIAAMVDTGDTLLKEKRCISYHIN